MKALILVNIQNDFLPGGALPVNDGDAVIPLLNRLQPYFDVVVAIQDWHPANHTIFVSNHPDRTAFDDIYLHGVPQTLLPDHCVQGTKGAELSSSLDQSRISAIIRNGTHPDPHIDSGFCDHHGHSTGLAGYLQDKGVGDIYVTGLAGDFSVYYTAQDGLRAGFKTFIIEDATRSVNPEGFDEAMSVFISAGGKTILSDAVFGG
ncbi:MAG: nicotinamidase [Mucilaginibacter sp.]